MKRMHRSQWLTITCVLMLLVAALVMAGCSSQQAEAPQPAAPAESKDLILATTTSTQDTGLLDALIPVFEQKTGYKVKTVAVGTGAALAMGEKGEADVLLVHAPADEQKLVTSGVGINYQLVMHNDFVLVGPANDPAKVKGLTSSAEAFKRIVESKNLFVSRGDNSGTHKKELAIWKTAGIEVPKDAQVYQETGQGMGQTLVVANEKKAYTLTDRGTFLAQQKNLQLGIVVEGEKDLLNIYHVMQVNPEKFPKVNAKAAKAFVDFMVAADTQQTIGKFGVDKYGSPLFFPDAGKKEDQIGK